MLSHALCSKGILVEQKVVHKAVVEAAASKQASVSEKKAVEARLIRVQADKLDQLIDLVGELVIAGASANLLAQPPGAEWCEKQRPEYYLGKCWQLLDGHHFFMLL